MLHEPPTHGEIIDRPSRFPDRRLGRTSLVCGLVAVALGLSGCGSSEPPEACPPACNVLLISIDTLTAKRMSLYGYERETTPNLDEFAKDAYVFENATSQSAWTTPTHAGMMTGLYPSEHGLIYYSDPGVIREENRTLAEILRKVGYRTGGFNGAGYTSKEFGFDRGFEVYDGYRHMDRNIGNAVSWMIRHRREPFFAFVHGFDVHRPYLPPERFDIFTEPGKEWNVNRFCVPGDHSYESEEHLEFLIGRYDGGILSADHLVGTLLDNIELEGFLDNTIIIITSDHGEEFFEHGDCDHVNHLYDEITRVPLIVRIPGTEGGRIAARVPASVGVMPTVLDLLEIDYRVPPGRSWRPWIEDPSTPHAVVLSETGYPGMNVRALVDHPWKMILETDLQTGEEAIELFHLVDDPGEQVDVAAGNPEVVARLGAEIRKAPIADPPEAREFSPELTKELEALGYL